MPDIFEGLFWEEQPKIKKLKPVPPERVWERPDYLPHLEEARAFPFPLFTQESLFAAALAREELVFDTECYPNYWAAGFMSLASGKVLIIEMREGQKLNTKNLEWVMHNFKTIGFNSLSYDLPLTSLAIAGQNTGRLQLATQRIIELQEQSYHVLKSNKVRRIKCDHVDVMNVAPVQGSLKMYAGRLHAPRMQDLPFLPGTVLSEDQITITRWYLVNDLINTAWVHAGLKEQLLLRDRLTARYGIDLRSKSDAQAAETVITAQVERMTGMKPARGEPNPGKIFKYHPPAWLKFQSPLLNWLLEQILAMDFEVSYKGTIQTPPAMHALPLIEMGMSKYKIGIGGMHSTESVVSYQSNDYATIRDIDFDSYYPLLMLKGGLFPDTMGPAFRVIFKEFVDERLTAKKLKDKNTANSLKIFVNGTYGKTAQPFSTVYAPQIQMWTCVTGQLCELMLAERFELAGISVISANTDGLVSLVPNHLTDTFRAIVKQMERETEFTTEETIYKALYARDVNSYMAVREDGTVKLKGAYGDPWSDPKEAIFRYHYNPDAQICVTAAKEFVLNKTPPAVTIRNCRDISRFVCVRKVKGGAVKNGEYLGKDIRWYYAKGEVGGIIYAKSGNLVASSTGAKPLMTLPADVPEDIDYDWYESATWDSLVNCAAIAEFPKHMKRRM